VTNEGFTGCATWVRGLAHMWRNVARQMGAPDTGAKAPCGAWVFSATALLARLWRISPSSGTLASRESGTFLLPACFLPTLGAYALPHWWQASEG
jgi:hypothetical protein